MQQHDIETEQEHEKTNQLTTPNKRPKAHTYPMESDEENNMPLKKRKRNTHSRK
jgi:hypothetical protein